MAKYLARTCPKCKYYLAFTLSKPVWKAKEIAIKSFCLNCNYKIPLRMVVLGNRSNRWQDVHRVKNYPSGTRPGARPNFRKILPRTTSYSQPLRAIGQNLEALNIKTFNLECKGNTYLVWAKADAFPPQDSHHRLLNKGGLQAIWRKARGQSKVHPSPEIRQLRYSPEYIDRLEHKGRARRLDLNGMPDGHSLSQLLRTIGDHVNKRSNCLLGISRQELSISIVVETAQGRREIDVFRLDNLYELWVRMYLRRSNRSSSMVPL